MPSWKKNIFVNAIRTRMVSENRTKNDIVKDYIALTADEKAELFAAI